MVLDSPAKGVRLKGMAICAIVGVPLLVFALSPFPGMGMIYTITDSMRGHPHKRHGTQPAEFVGLWVRDETVMHDFFGQAFYLLPDGGFAGLAGVTRRRWHFDNSSLYVDSSSGCGNCYRGNVTTECAARFVGPDHLLITNRDVTKARGIGGSYRRVEITDELKANLGRMQESKDDSEYFRARCVLRAIEHFESLSKPDR